MLLMFVFFFFNDTATTEIYTLSLHDALPISPIPFDRDGARDVIYHQHVGVYAYTREALDRWIRLAPVPEERWERLEQLRPLLHGIPIGVALFPGPAAPGVDTADDLRYAVAQRGRQLREVSP